MKKLEEKGEEEEVEGRKWVWGARRSQVLRVDSLRRRGKW